MLADSDNWDVLVVGGGPAGSTAAALLAEQGLAVLLLEKDQHPRFHIGESLLPNNLPILNRLGVLERVSHIGVEKPGAEFAVGEEPESMQSFAFARALGETPGHAFQVVRSEFDALLFERARELGATAICGVEVLNVDLQSADGRVRAKLATPEGPAEVNATYLVDASGRHGLLGRALGLRKRSNKHASAAVFGHFKGVELRPGEHAGYISVYWFAHGWIWMIPLRDGVMSVGAVCWPDYLKTRKHDAEQFLRDTLAQVPAAHGRMRQAVSAAPVQVTGNFSYRTERAFGDNWMLVGDAYAFIDPVFSSGVYLAMSSAEQAVPVIAAGVSGQPSYKAQARRYVGGLERRLSSFSWFIYRFTTPTMRDLFKAPRNDWQVEQAVISMLAGDGDGSPQIRNRLRVFKVIYYGYWLKRLKESFVAWRRRAQARRVAFDEETVLK